MDAASLVVNLGVFVATCAAAAVAWWQAIAAGRGQVAAERARDAAVKARQEAAVALSGATDIARQSLAMSTRVDERQREFRAVDWDATTNLADEESPIAFELTNRGDTDAMSVTLVLYLNPDMQTHALGDVPARTTTSVTSPELTEWMRGALEYEVVHPSYRVHWSSPLGQVSDERYPQRSVEDFIRWDER